MSVVTLCLTVKPNPDRMVLVTEPSVYTLESFLCAVFLNEEFDL